VINYLSKHLLLAFLVMNTTVSYAQKISVESGEQTAGFSYTADSGSAEPVIYYQQNIQMLSSIADKASISIYGDGHVLVHYPVYMKKAGDYEMKLDETELVELMQSFSSNGVLDFDEAQVKKNIYSYKKNLHANGKFHEVSDGVVTSITIRLDEYQKNKSTKVINNYFKDFRLANIEHAAKQFYQNTDVVNANKSVLDVKSLMEDARLVKMERR